MFVPFNYDAVKDLADGTPIYNYPVYCANCSKAMFYYCDGPDLHGRVLGKKAYCLNCYPRAVDVYLADKRLL